MRLTPSPCGRPYAANMKYTSLSWNSEYNDVLDLKQKFNYDCNLFKTVLLVIYSTNLYWRKISTFCSVQRRNSGTIYANFFAWEDRMISVGSNYLCGHGVDPIRKRPPEPNPLPYPRGSYQWMTRKISWFVCCCRKEMRTKQKCRGNRSL